MIADMLSNKKFNREIVTMIFSRKLKIALVLIMLSYFAVLKNIRLNLTHCFMMKNSNKSHLIIG